MLNAIGFKTSHPAALIVGLALCSCIGAAFAFEEAPAGRPGDEAAAAPAVAAEPGQGKDWDKVMQLGRIQVEGDQDQVARQIVAGLKVIKRALVTNISNDPARANDIVCRVNYDTGSHLQAHLICATNHTLMLHYDEARAGTLAATSGQANGAASQELEHLAGRTPSNRYFSTHVNASELQKLLLAVKCDGCSNSGLVVGNN